MQNKIIIYPTDTVWGIGCDIFQQKLVENIAKIKNTDSSKPVSVLFGSIEQINEYVDFHKVFTNDQIEKLFDFEITIGFDKSFLKKEIPRWITNDSSIVGIRYIKGLKNINSIISLENPIVTTSLNLHGEQPISTEIDAKVFCDKNIVCDYLFVNEKIVCSGNSSSFVIIDTDKRVNILRNGNYIDDIKRYLRTIPTVIL